MSYIFAGGRRRLVWGAAAAALIFAGCGKDEGEGCDGQSGGGYTGGYGEVADADGQKYKTVKIGGQVWMAENLNYKGAEPNTTGRCYNDNADNCAKYGRLYSWAEAMGLDASYNSQHVSTSQIQTPHQGICPEGWHIPTRAEWDVLTAAVGGGATDGKHLKSTGGWHDCGACGSGKTYLCWDTYGFAASPGGYYSASASNLGFYHAGYSGRWWSADENSMSSAYYRYIYNVSERAEWKSDNTKSDLYSVRCVQN